MFSQVRDETGSKEREHENRKHAFDGALSGAFICYVDITSLGATRGVGGSRCKVSSSAPESISERPRSREYQEQSRKSIPGLPVCPRLPSVAHRPWPREPLRPASAALAWPTGRSCHGRALTRRAAPAIGAPCRRAIHRARLRSGYRAGSSPPQCPVGSLRRPPVARQ